MLKNYKPENWYWLADDGRIFSSAKVGTIDADDTTYASWKGAGNWPTRWPSDESGAQTVAALQDVLAAYGLFADLKLYARAAFSKALSAGVKVDVGTENSPHVVFASTDAVSLSLLNSAVAVASANAQATTPWVPENGLPVTLTAAQVLTINAKVQEFVQRCFGTLAELLTAIATGAVDTRAQVDAAFV